MKRDNKSKIDIRYKPSQQSITQNSLNFIIVQIISEYEFYSRSRHVWAERLQIGTDLLRIITSTADELSSGTNIDDLERP